MAREPSARRGPLIEDRGQMLECCAIAGRVRVSILTRLCYCADAVARFRVRRRSRREPPGKSAPISGHRYGFRDTHRLKRCRDHPIEQGLFSAALGLPFGMQILDMSRYYYFESTLRTWQTTCRVTLRTSMSSTFSALRYNRFHHCRCRRRIDLALVELRKDNLHLACYGNRRSV